MLFEESAWFSQMQTNIQTVSIRLSCRKCSLSDSSSRILSSRTLAMSCHSCNSPEVGGSGTSADVGWFCIRRRVNVKLETLPPINWLATHCGRGRHSLFFLRFLFFLFHTFFHLYRRFLQWRLCSTIYCLNSTTLQTIESHFSSGKIGMISITLCQAVLQAGSHQFEL